MSIMFAGTKLFLGTENWDEKTFKKMTVKELLAVSRGRIGLKAALIEYLIKAGPGRAA